MARPEPYMLSIRALLTLGRYIQPSSSYKYSIISSSPLLGHCIYTHRFTITIGYTSVDSSLHPYGG